jgi:hypothetical protein
VSALRPVQGRPARRSKLAPAARSEHARGVPPPGAISRHNAPYRSCAASGRLGLVGGRVGQQRHRACSPERAGLLIFFITLLFSGRARAEPGVEFSGGAGFGVLAAGVTSGRFAISPSGSLSVRGERGFFVARDTVSFLGAPSGRFGITNETTLGGGLFWESVNVSAGLSLAVYSLPICGPRLCGRVHGLSPGASARLDLFGPYIEGGLGVSVDCAGAWITGPAYPVWSGVSVRCSAGPILRFTSHR